MADIAIEYHHQVDKLEKDLSEISDCFIRISRTDIYNLEWYSGWSVIWNERIVQMRQSLNIQKQWNEFIESIKSTRKTNAPACIRNFDNLLKLISALNAEMIWFFGDENSKLIETMKFLEKSPKNVANLNLFVEIFTKWPKINELRLTIPHLLQKIEESTKCIKYDIELSKEDDSIFLRSLIESTLNECKQRIEILKKYFKSLKVKIGTSLIDDNNSMSPTMENFEKLSIKFRDLEKQKNKFAAKDKHKQSWYDRWVSNANTFFKFLNALISLSVTVSAAKIPHNPQEPFYELLFNVGGLTGPLEVFTKQLWSVFERNGNEVVSLLLNSNIDLTPIQLKALDGACDELDKVREADSNARKPLREFVEQMQSLRTIWAKIKNSGAKSVTDDDYKALDKAHFNIITEYEKNGQLIKEYVDRHLKFITELNAALSMSNRG